MNMCHQDAIKKIMETNIQPSYGAALRIGSISKFDQRLDEYEDINDFYMELTGVRKLGNEVYYDVVDYKTKIQKEKNKEAHDRQEKITPDLSPLDMMHAARESGFI